MIFDLIALVVMAILIALVIWLVVLLGPMPGRIAKRRGHPQADAIAVLGWVGVVTLGLAWPIALVWAYTRTSEQHVENLSERIAVLEAELASMKSMGGEA